MRHVVNIRNEGNVHLAGVNSHTLCGLMKLTKNIEGTSFPIAADVKQEANCQACKKALEMLVRRRLGKLSTAQLEHIWEEIS